jgi:hypothetical protein
MTYGLYIGICSQPVATATTKEELRNHLDTLDPLDRAQGWTISPIEERWPRFKQEKSPIALTVGLTLLVLCIWIIANFFVK